MAQWFLPGGGFLNEGETQTQILLPGGGFLNANAGNIGQTVILDAALSRSFSVNAPLIDTDFPGTIFMSGWETGTNLDFWSSATKIGASSGVSGAVRRGPTYAFYVNSSGDGVTKLLDSASNELFVQACFNWVAAPSASPGEYIRILKGSKVVCTVNVNSSNKIEIYTGSSGTLRATGSTVLVLGRWYVFEVHVKVNASGTIAVRLDGVDECSWSGDTTVSALVAAKARWKFNSGSLLTDSIGGNTLTDHGTVTAFTGHPKEGSACAEFIRTSAQWLSRADTDLSAGFPLKNGDATKKITVCYWIKMPTGVGGTTYYDVCGKSTAATKLCLRHVVYSGKLYFYLGYNNGASEETKSYPASSTWVYGRWYHVAFTIDGIAKTLTLRVYDDYAKAVVYTVSAPFTNELNVEDAAWTIGTSADGPSTNYFDGLLDDMIVFADILDPAVTDMIQAHGYDVYIQDHYILDIRPPSTGVYIDDVIVNEAGGSFNNSWVDQAAVALLKMNAGTVDGWSALESSMSGWSKVEFIRNVPAGLNDFIYINAAGVTHQAAMQDHVVNTESVMAMQQFATASYTPSAGVTNMKFLVKAGSTVYSSDVVLGGRPSIVSALFELNPAGSTYWTVADIDALETGVKSA